MCCKKKSLCTAEKREDAGEEQGEKERQDEMRKEGRTMNGLDLVISVR